MPGIRWSEDDLMAAEAKRQGRRAAGDPLETKIQQQIVKWYRDLRAVFRDLPLLIAIPNGADVSDNHRNRLVAEGMESGVADLFLIAAERPYYGLWIEVKRGKKGKQSPAQKDFESLVTKHGYCYQVARDVQAGQKIISNYLGLDEKVEWVDYWL